MKRIINNRIISILLVALLMLSFVCTFSACQPEEEINEYQFDTKASIAMADPGKQVFEKYDFSAVLYLVENNYRFYAKTEDAQVANNFVNAQIRLLNYLKDKGVPVDDSY